MKLHQIIYALDKTWRTLIVIAVIIGVIAVMIFQTGPEPVLIFFLLILASLIAFLMSCSLALFWVRQYAYTRRRRRLLKQIFKKFTIQNIFKVLGLFLSLIPLMFTLYMTSVAIWQAIRAFRMMS